MRPEAAIKYKQHIAVYSSLMSSPKVHTFSVFLKEGVYFWAGHPVHMYVPKCFYPLPKGPDDRMTVRFAAFTMIRTNNDDESVRSLIVA